MAKIRNLKGGVFYRPVDTKMGAAGWSAEIFYEEFTPRRNSTGNKDRRKSMRANWTQREIHFGPRDNESEIRAIYDEKYKKLAEIAGVKESKNYA